MSLACPLGKQGKRDEARAMLSEIYNWFTEGFDTADLKDAKGADRAVHAAHNVVIARERARGLEISDRRTAVASDG